MNKIQQQPNQIISIPIESTAANKIRSSRVTTASGDKSFLGPVDRFAPFIGENLQRGDLVQRQATVIVLEILNYEDVDFPRRISSRFGGAFGDKKSGIVR